MKSCSENVRQICWRALLPKCDSNIKSLCNFIETALRHGFSPVNLLHIFRTLFPKNTSGRLLLPEFIFYFEWLVSLRWTHLKVNVLKLKSDSNLPKKKTMFYLLDWEPFKIDENFIFKALFLLKIFKFLSRLFSHVGKTVWLERWG